MEKVSHPHTNDAQTLSIPRGSLLTFIKSAGKRKTTTRDITSTLGTFKCP